MQAYDAKQKVEMSASHEQKLIEDLKTATGKMKAFEAALLKAEQQKSQALQTLQKTQNIKDNSKIVQELEALKKQFNNSNEGMIYYEKF